MSRNRYVIHLPVHASDLAAAIRLARVITRMVSFLPQLEPGATTVSEEDAQGSHHWAYCDKPIPCERRCALEPDHGGPCTGRPRMR